MQGPWQAQGKITYVYDSPHGPISYLAVGAGTMGQSYGLESQRLGGRSLRVNHMYDPGEKIPHPQDPGGQPRAAHQHGGGHGRGRPQRGRGPGHGGQAPCAQGRPHGLLREPYISDSGNHRAWWLRGSPWRDVTLSRPLHIAMDSFDDEEERPGIEMEGIGAAIELENGEVVVQSEGEQRRRDGHRPWGCHPGSR